MLSLWSLPRWQQQILTFSFEFTPIYVAVTLAGCKVTATNMDLFIRVYTYMCCCHLGRLQSDSNKYGPFYSSLHLLYVAVTLAGSKVTAWLLQQYFDFFQIISKEICFISVTEIHFMLNCAVKDRKKLFAFLKRNNWSFGVRHSLS